MCGVEHVDLSVSYVVQCRYYYVINSLGSSHTAQSFYPPHPHAQCAPKIGATLRDTLLRITQLTFPTKSPTLRERLSTCEMTD